MRELPPIKPGWSRTCEVWTGWQDEQRERPSICGEPTTHCYPAAGGGSMALCALHAQAHLSHGEMIGLTRVEDIIAPSAASSPQRSEGE